MLHLITIGLLLQKEPSNLQAQSLDALISQAVTKGMLRFLPSCAASSIFPAEGYIGMALAGGAAAIGTLIIANFIRRATRQN